MCDSCTSDNTVINKTFQLQLYLFIITQCEEVIQKFSFDRMLLRAISYSGVLWGCYLLQQAFFRSQHVARKSSTISTHRTYSTRVWSPYPLLEHAACVSGALSTLWTCNTQGQFPLYSLNLPHRSPASYQFSENVAHMFSNLSTLCTASTQVLTSYPLHESSFLLATYRYGAKIVLCHAV